MSQKKLPLNPKAELFHWGPIPGRLFYPSDFVAPMFSELLDTYGECWPPSLFLFHAGRMVWVNEHPIFRERGRKVFIRYMLPKASREQMRREWRRGAVKSLLECGEEIERKNLRNLSHEEFVSLWKKFYARMNAFWVPTIIQELGNYGSETYLREKLIAAWVPERDLAEVIETLTAPEELSFYQKEEIELAETRDSAAHRRKYFWLKNSYNGSRVLPLSFFTRRKKKLPNNLGEQAKKRIAEARRRKREVAKQYKLPQEVCEIAEAITFGIEWQDERKGYIFKTIHHKTLLLRELARRTERTFDELLNMSVWEAEKLLIGREAPDMPRRRIFFGLSVRERNVRALTEQEAREYWLLYVETNLPRGVHEFPGVVVSKGAQRLIRGRVRVMNNPHALGSFSAGEILVAAMTSPEYVFAMKKAAAIITDTGGLTSHAAVTSRELGKLCIVGTKVATTVLRDGDMVEVNANEGVVKIVKRA